MSDKSGDNRRKFTSYLQLDSESDREALAVVETISQRVRGDFLRNAIISAAALHQLGPRLPTMLAALFNGKMTSDQLVSLNSPITDWRPSIADIRDVIASIPNLPMDIEPVRSDYKLPPQEENQLDKVRVKLGKLL
ncbi:plasmid partitioning/stability family protein [Serratia sp. M24T3]|uniref:plasmid partitioning/stability family protein n=1 Tax=Serratia sp. M24T3 TaxID=932213 RepID=UPI00025BBAB3|nr:plasmid partitioning/stability family protein [Serratia sp. M24T3]EIC83142.1 InhB [Serratia sp. M24T3]